MTLHISQLPKLILERRSSAIFGVLIIAMLWGAIGLKFLDDVRADRSDAERTNANFAMVFEENVLRSIGEIDKALLYLRRTIETRQASTSFHDIVSTADVLSEIIVQVAIIDAKGIMRASNAGPQPAPPTDLSDREHYRVHVGSNEDLLFISKPVVGRISKQWSVQFTRRFLDPDGNFGGVVVASLDPDHLTNFYNRIDLGTLASIALIGSDAVVRSSGGSSGVALGTNLLPSPIGERLRAGVNVTFDGNDPAKGEPSVITLRQVRGHPLWVSVFNDVKDMYRNAWTDLYVNLALGFVLTLIVLAALERILRSEAAARQKAEQLKLTLENMSQGIMLVTSDLQIPVINSKCGELLHLPRRFVENPPRFDELLAYQEKVMTDGPLAQAAENEPVEIKPDAPEVSVTDRTMPDGTVIEVRSGHLADGSLIQTFTDITKRREAEAHVARLASEDPLTGLPNRRVLRARLDEICREHSGSNGRGFAALFLDLDRFKVVNDTLGHRIGDKLLQEVAARLRSVLPPSVALARLGGDEFAVVVPEFDSRSEIEAMARSILSAVARPYEIDGYHIRSEISVGIALGPQDGGDVDGLLVAADLALYAVKANGRGTYKFYSRSMQTELNERREIENDLRVAIERNELELHYQPIINLRRKVVVGFEALARWRHPERGMVPPNVFIPVAEDSGLILPIGEWALKEACRAAVEWPYELGIAVNMSPAQLMSPTLLSTVERALADSGLAPKRLEIEITERTIMEDSEYTMSTLRKLKEMGVRIAMDDFGTGYSSLSYLRKFPFDKIKIDRSFVSDLKEGTEHVVIVQAVVSIARALGMTTTAEGIEDAYQNEFLTALGCDEAQGYLFSPAVPLERVPDLVERWSKNRAIAA
jgi:diguanylate cyclase (GGDEF)-like protein